MDDAESDSDSDDIMDNINVADLIGSSIRCDMERKLERKDMSKQDTNILSDMPQVFTIEIQARSDPLVSYWE
ncbi:hypothetical protein FRC03_006597 [Tulasnella sp. 419]|nr:hypothetical protein FRC03_006597 [Tulasnella sp. 419]